MQYRHLHKGINTGNDAATFLKNLANFRSVTTEIMFLIMCTFGWLFGENQKRSPFVALAFSNALED